MKTAKTKGHSSNKSKAAEPFFQPSKHDGFFANTDPSFFRPARLQPKPAIGQRRQASGERPSAHELTPVAQPQGPAVAHIQLARLLDYKDKKPEHDPSKLSDAEIEATNEFKAYMDPTLVWQTSLKVTKDEARLACRLMLRSMREGNTINWKKKARSFVKKARKQLGTLQETEKLVGKPKWVASNESEFKSPTTATSDFAKWMLGGGAEPTNAGAMNCWEMVLFGAFKGKIVTKAWLQAIYKDAAKKSGMDIPAEIEKRLCSGKVQTYDPADPDSPEPLPGDILIFNKAAKHVAIARGKKGGTHEAISHWDPPGFTTTTQKTTIKKLLTHTSETKVKFCTSPW